MGQFVTSGFELPIHILPKDNRKRYRLLNMMSILEVFELHKGGSLIPYPCPNYIFYLDDVGKWSLCLKLLNEELISNGFSCFVYYQTEEME